MPTEEKGAWVRFVIFQMYSTRSARWNSASAFIPSGSIVHSRAEAVARALRDRLI